MLQRNKISSDLVLTEKKQTRVPGFRPTYYSNRRLRWCSVIVCKGCLSPAAIVMLAKRDEDADESTRNTWSWSDPSTEPSEFCGNCGKHLQSETSKKENGNITYTWSVYVTSGRYHSFVWWNPFTWFSSSPWELYDLNDLKRRSEADKTEDPGEE